MKNVKLGKATGADELAVADLIDTLNLTKQRELRCVLALIWWSRSGGELRELTSDEMHSKSDRLSELIYRRSSRSVERRKKLAACRLKACAAASGECVLR